MLVYLVLDTFSTMVMALYAADVCETLADEPQETMRFFVILSFFVFNLSILCLRVIDILHTPL